MAWGGRQPLARAVLSMFPALPFAPCQSLEEGILPTFL